MTECAAEVIPDEDALYLRVHRAHFARGEVLSPAFRNHPPGGLSTNWSRYSSPEETRAQARQPPENYGVLGMKVGSVRAIPQQEVVHSPLPDNRAHADVVGPKADEAILDGFQKACAHASGSGYNWELEVGQRA